MSKNNKQNEASTQAVETPAQAVNITPTFGTRRLAVQVQAASTKKGEERERIAFHQRTVNVTQFGSLADIVTLCNTPAREETILGLINSGLNIQYGSKAAMEHLKGKELAEQAALWGSKQDASGNWVAVGDKLPDFPTCDLVSQFLKDADTPKEESKTAQAQKELAAKDAEIAALREKLKAMGIEA